MSKPSGSAFRIAVLGGNGQIGRALVKTLAKNHQVHAVTRRPVEEECGAGFVPVSYDGWDEGDFQIIINAAGPGDPAIHRSLSREDMEVFLDIDGRVMEYLADHPNTQYIHISTGAVLDHPCMDNNGNVTAKGPADSSPSPYVDIKAIIEKRHRSRESENISDLRVFGYVSEDMRLESGFFLAQVVRCLKEGKPFLTSAENFSRDYIGPPELSKAIQWLFANPGNRVYNLLSGQPVLKFEILAALAERFGLEYSITKAVFQASNFPLCRFEKTPWDIHGTSLGFPRSLDVVMRETELLLERHSGNRDSITTK